MGFLKLFAKLFKKIKGLFSKKKGKGDESTRLPGERRIGIYGPSNVGKSVFFTMLYKACRQDREFNLSPDDQGTGKQLVNNLNTLRAGEWLPGTVEETALNFKASMRGGSQFPFSTRDYKGETVDLEQEGSAKEKLIAYFQDCDAILFMLSPEMIADPRKCEREIMSFTAMINQVTERGGRGLRIPIGLMITKADSIDGFENDTQVTLIDRKAEYLKAKDFNTFVEGVVSQYHVARNIVFQETVRETMHSLSLFFDFLMTLSMEFQVFFISSVGHVRSVDDGHGNISPRPPEDPDGIGVKTPFLWVIETIRRKEKIAVVSGVRRFVFRLALIILAFYSIFYGLHFLPARPKLVDMTSAQQDLAPQTIQEELEGHRKKWIVRNFSFFALPGANADQIPLHAEQLDASYKAHRFLDEELPNMVGTDAIRQLAETFPTPEWRTRTNSWYAELPRTPQIAVDQAVWNKVHAHNTQVAMRVQDLQYSQAGEGTPDEVQSACERIMSDFVQPAEANAAYRDMYENAQEVCRRIGLASAERDLLAQWDEIRDQLDEVTQYSVPDGAEITGLRASATDFRSKAKESSSPDVRDLADIAERIDDFLRDMVQVLALEDDGERRSILRRMRNESTGVLGPFKNWAIIHGQSIQRRESEEAAEQTKTEILARLGSEANMAWMLDPEVIEKVSQMRVSGPARQARDEYVANARALRRDGADLKMKVHSAPTGFVVVAWDRIESDYGRDEAAAGFELSVRWVAGHPVRYGIRRSGTTQTCPAEAQSVFKMGEPTVIPSCAGSQGMPTHVTFEGLDTLLQERLQDKLTLAVSK